MRILAIETSHATGSIAAAEDGRPLAEESFEEGMIHGRELAPRCKAMLARLGWSLREVDLIAVSIGPGSYTGLRVGVMTAKTLAYAVGVQVVAVPTLDVLARNAPEGADHVCPVIDAKRKQVYACLYDAHRRRAGEVSVARPERLASELPGGTLVLGDALEYYSEVFNRPGIALADKDLWRPRAGVVAELGRELHRDGRRDDCLSLAPLYLQRTEAEDRWLARQEQEKEQPCDESGC